MLFAFCFARPAFNRGSRFPKVFFAHRYQVPTCEIAMHKCPVSHRSYNRLQDLPFRRRVPLHCGFALGLTLPHKDAANCGLSPNLFHGSNNFIPDRRGSQTAICDCRCCAQQKRLNPAKECQTLAILVGFLYCGEPASYQQSPVIQLTDNNLRRVDTGH